MNWNQANQTVILRTSGYTGDDGVTTGSAAGSGSSLGAPTNNTKPTTPSAKKEMRGAWISTVFNLDWPSTASAGNAAKQKQEFSALLDQLQGMGMNAVFVQVRPSGDALYKRRPCHGRST